MKLRTGNGKAKPASYLPWQTVTIIVLLFDLVATVVFLVDVQYPVVSQKREKK